MLDGERVKKSALRGAPAIVPLILLDFFGSTVLAESFSV